MKNKKVTYVLLVAVVLVWGFAILQIFGSLWGNQSEVQVRRSAPVGKIVIQVDTFSIINNYRDPFLRSPVRSLFQADGPVATTGSASKVGQKATVQEAKPVLAEEVIKWDFIQFIGLIKNKTNNKQVALVNIHGTSHMVHEGDTVQSVAFIRNYADSIEVGFKGKKTFIVRK